MEVPVMDDKRARKRAAREEAQREYEAQLRRRRNARVALIVVVLLVVVGAAFLTGDDKGGSERAQDPAAEATPEPTAGPEEQTEAYADDAEIACDGPEPPEANPQQYEEAPPLELEQGVDYSAVVSTSCGDIEMDLLEKKAPQTVANFIFLAQEGFFDGLIWHRVERSSVIQTGDPNGLNGVPPDGPGYTIPDEFPEKATEYVYGTVGQANAGPGSGGSQWFIVTHDPEGGSPAGFQPLYSIFGEVDEGSYEVLEEIGRQETRGGNDPAQAVMPVRPIYINSIEIIES
jgi:cyclophilin family peptidyl-prolyl cis-trans isomerase